MWICHLQFVIICSKTQLPPSLSCRLSAPEVFLFLYVDPFYLAKLSLISWHSLSTWESGSSNSPSAQLWLQLFLWYFTFSRSCRFQQPVSQSHRWPLQLARIRVIGWDASKHRNDHSKAYPSVWRSQRSPAKQDSLVHTYGLAYTQA